MCACVCMYILMVPFSLSFHSPSITHLWSIMTFFWVLLLSHHTNRHKAKRVMPLSSPFPSFSFLRLPYFKESHHLPSLHVVYVICVYNFVPSFLPSTHAPQNPLSFFFPFVCIVSVSLSVYSPYSLCSLSLCSFFFFPTITLLYARALGPACSLTHQQQHINKRKKDAKNTIGAERADFGFPRTQLIRILF
ncbi:hypothetical protein BKA57DRAFT_255805 [Linnemannia elongata]|nr:hypothetical protein BKA57DRAFT_255805 [Linnemannia elongata]